MWRKRIALGLGATVLAAILATAGTVVVVHLKHPRDEAAYLEYLRLYGRSDEIDSVGNITDAPIALPAIPALVAEGDRACDWLGHQGYALWRTDASHRVAALYERYAAATQGRQLAWHGDPPGYTVTAAAWTHLCPATLDLHKPHFVFTSSQPD